MRSLQSIDDLNQYWVENLYKCTSEGLVCVSKEHGYPKIVNVDSSKSTDVEVLTKHKDEWTIVEPENYLF